MFDIALFIGALVPTFLLSRLMLWALGRLNSGAPLAIIANSASLAISGTLLWFGAGSLANLWVYIIGQTLWLVLDLVRLRKNTAETRA
jgi:hypothetical protein